VYADCLPIATAGDDTISCTGSISGAYALKALGGSDKVTLDHVSGAGVYWMDESRAGNPATDGNDTFIAKYSAFNWVFLFGGNDRAEVYDSNFSNLYMDTNPNDVLQRGDDTIYIENSISNGWILGGNDSDTIIIKDSNVSFVVAGYSDIYSTIPGHIDFTPFDSNDTIILDHVGFTIKNYYYVDRAGVVESGKGDDMIRLIHGGEAKNVVGGHDNDIIEIYDAVHFTPCTFVNDLGNTVTCGIYGDEAYPSEPNATNLSLHGDDKILLYDADIRGIMVDGGHGSDLLWIETPVKLSDSIMDGGDDSSIADGHIDTLHFDQWSGELNGSMLLNWEHILLDNASMITFIDSNLSTGYDIGEDPTLALPYGLALLSNSTLRVYHDFSIYGNLHNEAILDMQDTIGTASTLTIEHNYTAHDSMLYIDTKLDDGMPNQTDKLLIKGDTSGETTVSIKNLAGTGAQTHTGDNDGILIIEVLGVSDGIFKLNHIIEIGDYKYNLLKGSNGNWYLQSTKNSPIPPNAKDDDIEIDTLGTFRGSVIGNDFVGSCKPSEAIWAIQKRPEHGEVILNNDGNFSYTPDEDYRGRDSFVYTIITASGCPRSNDAVVRIDIITPCWCKDLKSDTLSSMGFLGLVFTILGLLLIAKREGFA